MCPAYEYIQTTPVSFASSTLTHVEQEQHTPYPLHGMYLAYKVHKRQSWYARCFRVYMSSAHLYDTHTMYNTQSFVLRLHPGSAGLVCVGSLSPSPQVACQRIVPTLPGRLRNPWNSALAGKARADLLGPER
jgi:hypothetical protein